MKSQRDKERKNEVRVELKYCERCGGLWVRECGSGLIYCDSCQTEVAELPIPKERTQRMKLAIRRRAAIDDYSLDACAAEISNLRTGDMA